MTAVSMSLRRCWFVFMPRPRKGNVAHLRPGSNGFPARRFTAWAARYRTPSPVHPGRRIAAGLDAADESGRHDAAHAGVVSTESSGRSDEA